MHYAFLAQRIANLKLVKVFSHCVLKKNGQILLLESEDAGPGQGETVVPRELERDVPLKIPENPKPPASENVLRFNQKCV